MSQHAALQNWLPAKVLQPLRTMVERDLPPHTDEYFLLVSVSSRPEGLSLLDGLTVGDARAKLERRDTAPEELRTVFAATPQAPQGVRESGIVVRSERARLSTLTGKPHYAVKIEKRSDGASFLRRITVGRTRNHDIVLRDPSVSKYHASFQMLEDGGVLLKDQGSKNRTRVNGKRITQDTLVHPGDTIEFGAVKATLCTTRGLWVSIHDAG